MDEPNRIAKFFDYKADSFDGIYSGQTNASMRIINRIVRRNIQDRLDFTIQSLLPLNGKRILDVGCGSGRYGIELARRGADRIIGIDLSGEMLGLANRLAEQNSVAEQCQFVQTDVLEFQPDAPVDAAIANGFFDYVREPGPVLFHLKSITRNRIIATFPAKWALRTIPRKLWLNANGCPVYFYTESAIRELCVDAGLACRQLIRSGPIYMLDATPK
jgi:2-polyprenyl-3-methyl-5-hydroxy-6-metoxy-1,4-benzoquinol methylase